MRLLNGNGFSLEELPEPMYFPSAKILKNYPKKEFYISD